MSVVYGEGDIECCVCWKVEGNTSPRHVGCFYLVHLGIAQDITPRVFEDIFGDVSLGWLGLESLDLGYMVPDLILGLLAVVREGLKAHDRA